MYSKRSKLIRIAALAIALVMVFSAIPAFNQEVYAANGKTGNNDTYDNAQKIVIGTEYVGKSTSYSDKDWYLFELKDDGYINISTNSKYTDVEDWSFMVFKKGKTDDKDYVMRYVYKGNEGSGKSPAVGLKKGTYYIKVKPESYRDKNPTSYKFKVVFTKAKNWEYEGTHNASNPRNMTPKVKYYGTLYRDNLYSYLYADEDWYLIKMEDAGRVRLSFNLARTSNDRWKITIQNAAGTAIYYNDSFNSTNESKFNTPYIGLKRGNYYVKLEAPGNPGQRYDISVDRAYNKVWEKEKNDKKGTANVINLNTKYYGSISSSYGDEDYYKFRLKNDGYISIPVAHNAANEGDLRFKVLKEDGKTVIMNFVFKAKTKSMTSPSLGLAAGDYYLHVEDYSGWNPNTYTFSINFNKNAYWEKETNDGWATATNIKKLNTKYYGSSHESIDRSTWRDEDYYKFKLNKKDTISITLGHAISTYSWEIKIYDKNKKEVFSDYIDGRVANPATSNTVTLNADTYYLKFSTHNNNNEKYNFTINTGQSQKISLKNATITNITEKIYNGKPQTQNPKVVVNGRVLSPGTDYVLTYTDNVKVGFLDAEVHITGRGKYVGSKTRLFSIVKRLDRIAGDDRFLTGTKIANKIKALKGGGKFKSIVVANGLNFPDALAGAYLADQKGAPIILTADAKVRLNETLKYIQNNLASGGTVYILGGTSAVPASFTNSLNAKKIKNVRLGGSNRYETNVLTLKAVGIKNKELLVCTGTDFPDALISSATGRPIMIVNPVTGLTESQKKLLKDNKVKSVTIIGSASSVPAKVETQLKTASKVSVGRVTAANKYEMSVKVANKYFSRPKSVVVATGANFADALTGGPLALKMNGPLLLVGEKESEYKYAKNYVKTSGVTGGVVLGGTKAVSDATSRQIM